MAKYHRHLDSGNLYWYRIVTLLDGTYCTQYRRGVKGAWRAYQPHRDYVSWEDAYTALERHATRGALAVRFVGTF